MTKGEGSGLLSGDRDWGDEEVTGEGVVCVKGSFSLGKLVKGGWGRD